MVTTPILSNCISLPLDEIFSVENLGKTIISTYQFSFGQNFHIHLVLDGYCWKIILKYTTAP